MCKALQTILVFSLWFASRVCLATSHHELTFSSAEHVLLGDEVVLQFAENAPATPTPALTLPNGLALTYGQLVSLGDFYGVADAANSHGQSIPEQRERFTSAFNAFASNPASSIELQHILNVIQKEINYIKHGLQNGLREEDLYAQTGMELEREMNCLTGGGCSARDWWLYPGRYLTLAKSNWDHFGTDALLAYQTGHAIALDLALLAGKTHNKAQLELAYAMNAFACHFLSDRYSTGHMRTPRAPLPQQVTPELLGHMLVNLMHNEENAYGLHVHNQEGKHWIAFGDRSFLSEKSQVHRQQLLAAMQRSADELFATFLHGNLPLNDSVLALVPYPDEEGNAASLDISPLFYWDENTQQLMRRQNVNNPYDKHWTANWWSWSTFVQLVEGKKLPVHTQAELAASDLRLAALQAGLITDNQVLAWVNGHAE